MNKLVLNSLLTDVDSVVNNFWNELSSFRSYFNLPYNVYVKDGNEEIMVEFAVAGYDSESIKVTKTPTTVKVVGEIQENNTSYKSFYKGLTNKKINITLPVYPGFTFDRAELANGLLKLIFVKNPALAAQEVKIITKQ